MPAYITDDVEIFSDEKYDEENSDKTNSDGEN